MKRLATCFLLLCSCSGAVGFDVEPADVYFGANIEGGGVITGIANTLKIRRVFGAPLTDQDLDKAFEAARAYCAGQGEVFFDNGPNVAAGLPGFFQGVWEIEAECRP